jgi:hypothetical protein
MNDRADSVLVDLSIRLDEDLVFGGEVEGKDVVS